MVLATPTPPPPAARRSSWGSPGTHLHAINANTAATPPPSAPSSTPAPVSTRPNLLRGTTHVAGNGSSAREGRRRSLDSSLSTAVGAGCSFQQQCQLRAEQQQEWRQLFGEPISPAKADTASSVAAPPLSSVEEEEEEQAVRRAPASASSRRRRQHQQQQQQTGQQHASEPRTPKKGGDMRDPAHAQQRQQPPQQPPQQQQLRPLGPYFLGRTLGVGTFGMVVRGIHALTGEKVSVYVFVCKVGCKGKADQLSLHARTHTHVLTYKKTANRWPSRCSRRTRSWERRMWLE